MNREFQRNLESTKVDLKINFEEPLKMYVRMYIDLLFCKNWKKLA